MSFTDARVNAAVDAAVSGVTYQQLHTGEPGPAGTDNVAAGVSRQPISWSATAALQKLGTSTYVIPAAGGPFPNASLWTAATGGTYCGSAVVSPAESFAGPGTLGVTLLVAGSST